MTGITPNSLPPRSQSQRVEQRQEQQQPRTGTEKQTEGVRTNWGSVASRTPPNSKVATLAHNLARTQLPLGGRSIQGNISSNRGFSYLGGSESVASRSAGTNQRMQAAAQKADNATYASPINRSSKTKTPPPVPPASAKPPLRQRRHLESQTSTQKTPLSSKKERRHWERQEKWRTGLSSVESRRRAPPVPQNTSGPQSKISWKDKGKWVDEAELQEEISPEEVKFGGEPDDLGTFQRPNVKPQEHTELNRELRNISDMINQPVEPGTKKIYILNENNGKKTLTSRTIFSNSRFKFKASKKVNKLFQKEAKSIKGKQAALHMVDKLKEAADKGLDSVTLEDGSTVSLMEMVNKLEENAFINEVAKYHPDAGLMDKIREIRETRIEAVRSDLSTMFAQARMELDVDKLGSKDYKDAIKTEIDLNNQLAHYILTDIINSCKPSLEESQKQFNKTYEFWLSVAEKSFENSDFSTFFAISTGLSNSASSRLRKTLPPEIQERIQNLENKMDIKNNYGFLLNSINKSKKEGKSTFTPIFIIGIKIDKLLEADKTPTTESIINNYTNNIIKKEKIKAKQLSELEFHTNLKEELKKQEILTDKDLNEIYEASLEMLPSG